MHFANMQKIIGSLHSDENCLNNSTPIFCRANKKGSGAYTEAEGVLIRHNIDSPDGTYMVGRERQTSKPTFKPWIAGCIDI